MMNVQQINKLSSQVSCLETEQSKAAQTLPKYQLNYPQNKIVSSTTFTKLLEQHVTSSSVMS